MAKGAGGAAISTLAAIIGFVVGEAVTATSTETGPDGTTTTVSAAVTDSIPELTALILILLFVAVLAWFRSARIHSDFAEDLAMVSRLREDGRY